MKVQPSSLAFAAALLAASCVSAAAQAQQPGYKAGWPCVGKVDPVYVRNAEATGGKVLLFEPSEVSGVAQEISASGAHRETVFRTGGQVPDGAYEFDVPVDSAVESAYFFISLQCLQDGIVLQPGGEELHASAAGVEYHRFEAIRMYVVRRPTPGLWKVRIAGRGLLSVIVTAKSDLAIDALTFLEHGVQPAGGPRAGKPLRVVARIGGDATDVAFRLVSASAATLQPLDLARQESEDERTYAGEITPPEAAFRVAVTGLDAKGFPFQRVKEQLFIPQR